jgi:hypothetical protein
MALFWSSLAHWAPFFADSPTEKRAAIRNWLPPCKPYLLKKAWRGGEAASKGMKGPPGLPPLQYELLPSIRCAASAHPHQTFYLCTFHFPITWLREACIQAGLVLLFCGWQEGERTATYLSSLQRQACRVKGRLLNNTCTLTPCRLSSHAVWRRLGENRSAR